MRLGRQAPMDFLLVAGTLLEPRVVRSRLTLSPDARFLRREWIRTRHRRFSGGGYQARLHVRRHGQASAQEVRPRPAQRKQVYVGRVLVVVVVMMPLLATVVVAVVICHPRKRS